MFIQPAREPDPARLRFLCWLAERGRLEHEVLGHPIGRCALDAATEHPAAVVVGRPASRPEP